MYLYSQFYGLVPHDDISRQNEGFDVHYVCISTLCPHIKPFTLKRKMTKRDPKREMEKGGIIFVQERMRDHTGYVSIMLKYDIDISLWRTSKPIITILTNIYHCFYSCAQRSHFSQLHCSHNFLQKAADVNTKPNESVMCIIVHIHFQNVVRQWTVQKQNKPNYMCKFKVLLNLKHISTCPCSSFEPRLNCQLKYEAQNDLVWLLNWKKACKINMII